MSKLTKNFFLITRNNICNDQVDYDISYVLTSSWNETYQSQACTTFPSTILWKQGQQYTKVLSRCMKYLVTYITLLNTF